MELHTRFTTAYGPSSPIAQAGMAFVGMTPDLAVAVGDAGAMGSLGVGLLPAPVMTQVIAGIRAGTDGPFHVNFITVFTSPDQIDAVYELQVPAVSFHWGHPSPAWIDQLHAAGIRVFEQVGSVDAAKRGVGDGTETPDFNPMRVLRNRVVASSPTGDTRPLIGETVLGGERVELRRFTNLVPMRNATTGDFDEMPLLAGQGVGLVDAVKSAASVIADLTAGAREALDRYQ